MIVVECQLDGCQTEMAWHANWRMRTHPPGEQKRVDIECWTVKSVAAQIPIQICHELEAGAEYCICHIHANSVHVMPEWPNNDWDLEWLANCSCHTDVGETQLLKEAWGSNKIHVMRHTYHLPAKNLVHPFLIFFRSLHHGLQCDSESGFTVVHNMLWTELVFIIWIDL